jgi:indole-3-glycerol phosphate synthase
MYTRTDSFLDRILAHKVEENAACKTKKPLEQVRPQAEAQAAPLNFVAALCHDTVAVIAEVKKASPSKGVLIEDFDPVAIAQSYAAGGAAAVSVLADEKFFQGNVRYVSAIRQALPHMPLLFKEFVIDGYQVWEARSVGADAVLLIAAALDDSQLADLFALIRDLGMSPLVEVHNEAELERALTIGAALIGVNNRDLKTFAVDLGTTERLARLLPASAAVTLVAESGIQTADDVRVMGEAGARAVLVGEALVKSGAALIDRVREFSAVKLTHDES